MSLSYQKPALFATELNSILLPQFTDTLIIYLSPVYQVLNVNWSAFLKGILPTDQSHGWINGINRGSQLGSEDLGLPYWCVIGHCVSVMAAHGASKTGFLPPPTPPHIPSHSPPLLSILTAERDSKNTTKFSHQRQRRLAIIKTSRQLAKYFTAQHTGTIQS